ncbi:MAG: helicase-related protein [Cyanobacteriota bacterium]|nr:helicase-related protein [Cyanobacteriota bacterium]
MSNPYFPSTLKKPKTPQPQILWKENPNPSHRDRQTPIKLRDYQQQDKQELYQLIQQGYKRVLFIAPCAYGKTIVFSSIAFDALQKNLKVLIVVPFQALIQQVLKSLALFEIEAGVIAGGWKEDPRQNVQVAMRQTLERGCRESWFEPDLVIIDECHQVMWSKWAKNLFPPLNKPQNKTKKLSKPSPLLIGFTASPWRLSKRESFSHVFETQIANQSPGSLIASGSLVPTVCYGIAGADLKGVKMSKGDFATGELELRCNTPAVVKASVDNYERLCPERLTLVYAVGVKHAQSLFQEFSKRGHASALVTAQTSDEERLNIFDRFSKGEVKVLINVGVCSTGFDRPEVSCIILARPTQSKALYVQMIGRGMRLCPQRGKTDCLILDQGGNIQRHGSVEEIQYEPLAELSDAKKHSSGEAAVKNCPECGQVLKASQMQCDHCGYKFPVSEKPEPEDELQLLFQSQAQKSIHQAFRTLLEQCYFRRVSPEFARQEAKVFLHPQGLTTVPVLAWSKGIAGLKSESLEDQVNYLSYLLEVAEPDFTTPPRQNSWILYWFLAVFGFPPQQYKLWVLVHSRLQKTKIIN